MKVRELIQLMERNGWKLIRIKGDHRQYSHPDHPGVVTVPGNMGKDIPVGTLHAILKATGLKERL